MYFSVNHIFIICKYTIRTTFSWIQYPCSRIFFRKDALKPLSWLIPFFLVGAGKEGWAENEQPTIKKLRL